MVSQRAQGRRKHATARRLRRDVERLQAAYAQYVQATEDLASIQECVSIWPSSTADVAPTRCQLLEGHVERAGTRHRHRVPGTSVVLEWD